MITTDDTHWRARVAWGDRIGALARP